MSQLFSPSVARNKDAVREAFLRVVQDGARVLEVASGSGEHGAHIVDATQSLTWTYSDIDDASLASQVAWQRLALSERLLGPLRLDVTQPVADTDSFDAVFASNLVHISPIEVTAGLFATAGALTHEHGIVCLYGPFGEDGEMISSNARFSEDLKQRNGAWGVRDLQHDIVPLATAQGFTLEQILAMPANNRFVVFSKAR